MRPINAMNEPKTTVVNTIRAKVVVIISSKFCSEKQFSFSLSLVHDSEPCRGILITRANAMAPRIIPPQPMKNNSRALIVRDLKQS